MASIGIDPQAHDTIRAAIRDHFTAGAETDGRVADSVAQAEQEVLQQLSWGRDAGDAWVGLETAQENLVEAVGELIVEAQTLIPANLGGYVDRAIANLGLDSPYRLLDLSRAQFEAILLLQRERYKVLRDARQWHRPARLEAARAAFAVAAEPILTTAQQAELAQFQANIAANLEAVLDRELADYPETEEGSAEASAPPRLRKRPREEWTP